MSKRRMSTAIPVLLPYELTAPCEIIFTEHNYATVTHSFYVKYGDVYAEITFPSGVRIIQYYSDLYKSWRFSCQEMTDLSEPVTGYQQWDIGTVRGWLGLVLELCNEYFGLEAANVGDAVEVGPGGNTEDGSIPHLNVFG